MNVEFGVGTHIKDAAKLLVAAAVEHGAATGVFNDVTLNAAPGTTPDEVVRFFSEESARRAEVYQTSPAGKAAAQDAQDRRRTLQDRHDRLVNELPALDFKSTSAVLDWLCAIQEATDHIGVVVKRETIISTFESHGYEAGVNCGSSYKPGDQDNEFRWLVGQALDGLENGPAIHPILHKFAGEFRRRYTRQVALSAPTGKENDNG